MTVFGLVSSGSLMARPAHIHTQQIVTVARELFLEHGTTLSTAVIAQHLGISEGSIYRRFPTKADLLRRAMGLPDLGFCAAWHTRADTGEVSENLVEMCRAIVSHLREVIPRLQALRQCEAWESPHSQVQPEQSPPLRVRSALIRYLDLEVAAGRVDFADTELTARMLLGTLAHFVFLEHLGIESHDAEPLIERTVTFMLRRGAS